jgi:hypothetical protein
MKLSFLLLSICVSLLIHTSSRAQCPTTFYTSTSTVSGGNSSGSASLSNPGAILDGNVNSFALITSTNLNPADPSIFFIDLTLNATIAANTYFYLRVNTFTDLTIQTYNGATPINAPDITVTTKTVSGQNFFEFRSTQPVTRVRITFTNSSGVQQTRQIYEFYAGVPCNNPLPVSLVSFTAKVQENRTVALAWVTSMETNNKGFLIERSKDLIYFEKVAELTEVSSGSNALKTYHLTDFIPFAGTSYYRLTQTDLNGKATVYPAVSVILRDAAYGVFPNPVMNGQRFALRLDEPETARIHFFSSDGRTIPIQYTGIESGNLLLKTANKLSTGVYILTVEERGQTRKHRLVIE